MLQVLLDFLGVDWTYNAQYGNVNTLYQYAAQGAVVLSVVLLCWLLSTISKSVFRG